MDQSPDDLDRAAECVLWGVKYLRSYIVSLNADVDPAVQALAALMNELDRLGQRLLPPGEGWPEPKEGMGVIIPFVPKQRA